MLKAREIDRETVTDLIRLRPKPGQERLVASNAATIAQAAYDPHAWLRGLWVGDRPVGLIAMVDLSPGHPDFDETMPENAAYLWRLMIAAEHQGKGYGLAAMGIAFDQARRWGRERLSLHVADEAGSALAFYHRLGLEPTGRIDDGELFLIGPVAPPQVSR